MATSNHERVGKALELVRSGLLPFVEREMKAQYASGWLDQARGAVADSQAHLFAGKDAPRWDAAALLAVMWSQWNAVFKKTLGPAERNLVSELREQRNRWAHQQTFSSDDAYRVLDSAGRLLSAVSAPEAAEVERTKMDLLRLRFDEQVRTEKRRTASAAIESQAATGLKPWRDVISPHKDVASGRYQTSEFAADLWQVYLNEGADEYRNPVEFFRRTYLTESLKQLLANSIQRLSGIGGNPVVQLQTNFGGGKTHSMLALYHLASGAKASSLAGVEAVLADAGVKELPKAKPVVLVGNRISPGNPVTKRDGTVVRTLWGEVAWQLGGKKAFERIRLDDENATNPGDRLRELLNEYSPCLILIDEWVAYARQLHDQGDLPGGSFATQFTFAQTLTESAKAAKACLLVISLPASVSASSPQSQADDSEVGGQRGREALDRLQNVIGRVESSWRPASAEEGFEIVRRRLFEPMSDPAQYRDRDYVARAFADFYRRDQADFPPDACEADYERRLKSAYPIHPDIFDRLYGDWSTLVTFQRTRGVLRLMAAVIHSLWQGDDKNPLILPATIPIQDNKVQFELTRYLPENWVPVIERDVDGPHSLPLRMDGEVPALGRLAAFRRVARTIYLGTAPGTAVANQGIDDRRVKLGSAMPGEPPAAFGDALRRLAATATYLYQDGTRYWYATKPTVTKLAEDRAEQFRRDPDKVLSVLHDRVRAAVKDRADFQKVHPLPPSSMEVPDEFAARLVVLDAEHPFSRGEEQCLAMKLAQEIWEHHGAAPRLYRNTLVFLAADKSRLQELDQSVRKWMAWDSILREKEKLDLSAQQVRQAESQRATAADEIQARLPETYQWLLMPMQSNPKQQMDWQVLRLNGGGGPLVERASKKLKAEEGLLVVYSASRLRLEMDRVPLWRGNDVAIRQLIEDFGRLPYLPRLKNPQVLVNAIQAGLALLTWQHDSFAYAESFDEARGRYVGLRTGALSIGTDDPGLLVRPKLAANQMGRETPQALAQVVHAQMPGGSSTSAATAATLAPAIANPTRYHGSIALDPTRLVRDAGKVADEVVTHLVGLVGAEVKVTLEVEASVQGGVPDKVVRIVTENGRTLKFNPGSGFESD